MPADKRVFGSRFVLATGLLVAAVGCDPSSPAGAAPSCRNSAALSASATAAHGPAVQRLLLTARATTKPADVEAFYKSYIQPVLQRDGRVGDLSAFSDGAANPTYVVQVDLKSLDNADLNLALDILASGKSRAEAEKILAEFEKYFDLQSARSLTLQPGLSLSRHVLGTVSVLP